MESQGLSRFLFELASDERLGILAAVLARPQRHAQIARRLAMTDSETSRHLNRLSASGLVTKGPSGEYVPTALARVVSAGLPFLRFLETHRHFVLGHDLLVLPPEFVERLGALEDATLIEGMYKVVARQEQLLRAVKGRIWVLSEQVFDKAVPIMQEKSASGSDVRVIRPRQGFEDAIPLLAGRRRNYQLRLLGEVPLFVAVLDDVAGICFPTIEGKVDMAAMLLLQEPRAYGWAADLFAHFWDQARER